MTSDTRMAPAAWASWLNVILGAWLIISPWVVGFGDPAATWNTLAMGIVVLLAALYAAQSAHPTLNWLNAAFAIWLIVSPWVLGFSSAEAETANSVVLGVIVGMLALAGALAKAAPGNRIPA